MNYNHTHAAIRRAASLSPAHTSVRNTAPLELSRPQSTCSAHAEGGTMPLALPRGVRKRNSIELAGTSGMFTKACGSYIPLRLQRGQELGSSLVHNDVFVAKLWSSF